jgi:dephospho-CoA kinase
MALRTDTRTWPPLVVAGLTGGIASGKTTISRMFASLGAVVLNADDEGRAAVAPGEPALAELIAAFGPGYLLETGQLDRRALGERVFESAGDRAALDRITHPRIDRQLSEKLGRLAARPPASRVVIVEAAILIEAGWAPLVDKIIVVATQHSVQVARLMCGPGLTVSQAEGRIHSQLPLEERLRHADYRVSGEAPLSETRDQVHVIWEHLRRLAAVRA